jgi:L-asparaginase / beta-aspartyl-peptidase
MSVPRFVLAIHAGAGAIAKSSLDEEGVRVHLAGLRDALEAGRRILAAGGSALDAVQAAVECMEDNPLFNAGKGAVYTHEGTHALDAALMDGSTLKCAAVAGLNHIAHPIALARTIMEKLPQHVLLMGEGAERFAASQGISLVDPSYFDTEKRFGQWQKALEREQVSLDHDTSVDEREGKKGTVGAVALDAAGNLAAATSTGGMTNVRFGRVGDTPVVGAGTYANNLSCAVSCTGTGEEFIRRSVAYDIHARMTYLNQSLVEAATLQMTVRLMPGTGGLIALDARGNVALPYNALGMFRGVVDSEGRIETAIWE